MLRPPAHPAQITYGNRSLSAHQQRVLEQLPNYGDECLTRKTQVSIYDLAALTAQTGDEFAMFTLAGRRKVIRGDENGVPVTLQQASALDDDGWRFSAHTHPGVGWPHNVPSDQDKVILEEFSQQASSVILLPDGRWFLFSSA